jgi:hypothetical protein
MVTRKVAITLPEAFIHLSTKDMAVCYSSVLRHSSKYYDFFKGYSGIIILDTSPSFIRECNWKTLEWARDKIAVDYLLLPSIDYSAKKTIEIVDRYLEKWSDGEVSEESNPYVGVLQGVSLSSLQECYNYLKKKVTTIALPSGLEKISRREEIVRDLKIDQLSLYLDIYKNPYEEVPPLSSLGIVTSWPLRLASVLRPMTDYYPTPPSVDLFSRYENLSEKIIEDNIKDYLDIVKYSK